MENNKAQRKDTILKKTGRNSHHPLMAFIPEVRMIANAWMLQGNTGATSSVKLFLAETLEVLSSKKVGVQ
jgi:hypothetical protein